MSEPDQYGIFWNIHVRAFDGGENGTLVELSWGWTAGMSEEDLANYAEDAPRGHDSLITCLDSIRDLRDKLNEILARPDLKEMKYRACTLSDEDLQYLADQWQQKQEESGNGG